MRVRGTVLSILAGLLVTASAPADAATPRVVGGPVITTATAPYAAYVSRSGYACTGVVVNATTVWTAAHCVVDEDAPHTAHAASEYTVQAGLDQRGVADGHTQSVGVTSIRVHPGWPADIGDDVAVLKLATALDVSGAYVKPVAVATDPPAAGTVVRAIGYGLSQSGASPPPPDGRLRRIDLTATAPFDCTNENAVQLCASSPAGATCEGDSGGPLVTADATPLLVGLVTRVGAGCPAGGLDIFANITTPELRTFLGGSATPPTAPRLGTPTPTYSVIEYVGQTMTCDPGAFSGAPTYGAIFRDATTGAVLQDAGTSYTFQPADAGRRIQCIVKASNAGGTTQIKLVPTGPINALRDPVLRISVFSKTAYAVGSQSDSPTATVTTTNATGQVVRTQALAPGVVATRVTLPPGVYRVCLTTPQTTYYSAGSACIADTFTAPPLKRASTLVHRGLVHCGGSRCKVVLRVSRPAAGRRVTVKWVISRHGTRTRYVTRRVTLRSVTHLTSPAVPRHRTLRLWVYVPALQGYAKGTASIGIGVRH